MRLLVLPALLLAILSFQGCREDQIEEYYGRPDWLPSPIYQQLEGKGNFKSFLVCVNKAGYKRTLSGAGYFTVFAPNDEAFTKFLTEKGLSSADAIDSVLAGKIVKYALIYNAFEKDRLSDFQSNQGWIELSAFKRRTAYYTGVYTYTPLSRTAPIKVTAANRNGGYVFGDNNNKHIPYFIGDYMSKWGLSSADYNFFFPATPFTGFNVVDASVVTENILAENGVVHEVNKVILPLPSIDEFLDQKSEYKTFKDLVEKYCVQFLTHPDVTNRYKTLTGSSDPVYVKFYSSLLGFSPNNENFMKAADNDGQQDGWTAFVPTNEAVNAYVNEVLLKYGYTTIDGLPASVIQDFINAHLWQTTVWPSKFGNTANTLGEEARFASGSDVVEAKVLSNGFFYGTNKAQDTDVFRSVFGKAYLNPKYSLMTRFLQRELRATLVSPFGKYTVFLVSDEVLRKKGYDYDLQRNEWTVNGTANLAVENWSRLVNQHIVLTPQGPLTDFSGEGLIETYGGELVKFQGNTLWAAGNQEGGTATAPYLDRTSVVTITPTEEYKENAFNGKVYYLDSLFRYPSKGIGWYIRTMGDITLADTVAKRYSKFYDYLRMSDLYPSFRNNTEAITGVSSGTFHTIFIPTNAAMQQAIDDGVLPATVNAANREKVNAFIQYHIIPKFTIAKGVDENVSFETLFKTVSGESKKITIAPGPFPFTLMDSEGRQANVIAGYGSNVLGNRAIIHQIDNYLKP
jgi:uncharacterized surface protein with fasciclin (FAS1) repeats